VLKFSDGDRVKMRKSHPCGGNEWEILRTGIDVRIRCLTCGRIVMLPRPRFEKQVKEICSLRQVKQED